MCAGANGYSQKGMHTFFATCRRNSNDKMFAWPSAQPRSPHSFCSNVARYNASPHVRHIDGVVYEDVHRSKEGTVELVVL